VASQAASEALGQLPRVHSHGAVEAHVAGAAALEAGCVSLCVAGEQAAQVPRLAAHVAEHRLQILAVVVAVALRNAVARAAAAQAALRRLAAGVRAVARLVAGAGAVEAKVVGAGAGDMAEEACTAAQIAG